MRQGLLALLWALSGLVAAPALAAATPEAQALRATLVSRGFTCADSASGPVTCMGRVAAYPQPIAVIISPRYSPGSRLILHLHGWLEGKPWDATPQAILDFFDFPSLLAGSQVLDTLFILPFSTGRCATYSSDLVKGFETVLSQLYGSEPLPAAITLSGHSGAWNPMEAILEERPRGNGPSRNFRARIDSSFLFDAAYETFWTRGFRSLARANASRAQPRIFADYRRDTLTDFESRRLAFELGSAFESFELPEKSDHWDTVKIGLPRFLRELRD